jgi:hypothetical protein
MRMRDNIVDLKVHFMRLDLHYGPCDVQTVTTAPIFDIESTPSVGAPHGNKYQDSKKTEDKAIAPMKSVNCDCEVWLLGAEKGR